MPTQTQNQVHPARNTSRHIFNLNFDQPEVNDALNHKLQLKLVRKIAAGCSQRVQNPDPEYNEAESPWFWLPAGGLSLSWLRDRHQERRSRVWVGSHLRVAGREWQGSASSPVGGSSGGGEYMGGADEPYLPLSDDNDNPTAGNQNQEATTDEEKREDSREMTGRRFSLLLRVESFLQGGVSRPIDNRPQAACNLHNDAGELNALPAWKPECRNAGKFVALSKLALVEQVSYSLSRR
ncbi:hypothetical protein K440DRAFT_682117 [Wilcoxina mikolae CBS 423.85]|nr:hypothetical protein K440DRAFT_682117 [Wilcoxina mikolae CBS 423.85]